MGARCNMSQFHGCNNFQMAQLSTCGDYDALMKVVVVGESGVGKSSVITKYCEDAFHTVTNSTIGVDFRVKLVDTETATIKVQLWDTAGQERFRSLTSSYYRMADGIIFLYDTSEPSTLDALEERWISEASSASNETLQQGNVLVLGTKSDKEGNLATQTCAASLAKSLGWSHAVCSAKSGDGIADSLESFIKAVSASSVFIQKKTAPRQQTPNPPLEVTTCNSQFHRCFTVLLDQMKAL